MLKLLTLSISVVSLQLYGSSLKSDSETTFEILSSHLIFMTKEQIENQIESLPPNAEHFIFYFEPKTTKLIPKSKALIPLLVEKTTNKIPSMTSIITYFDENTKFDMSHERLEFMDKLLREKGFQNQHHMKQLDNQEIFIFLVENCCTQSPSTSLVLSDQPHKQNRIVLKNKGGHLSLNEPRATVDLTSPHELPTDIRIMSKKEYNARFNSLNNMLPEPAKTFHLFFKPKSMLLKEESQLQLETIIANIHSSMPCRVDVIGHTDTKGSKQYNLKHGFNRARAVATILKMQGVNSSNISVKSYGEEALLIQTVDEVSEPKNQNVEIYIK
jgi:outer membrane protein OmpA-like peptidoglycan-associated protein